MTRTQKTGLVGVAAALLLPAAWLWYDEASGARAARRARSDDAEIRLDAIEDLRGRDTTVAKDALVHLARDSDPRVAAAALRALGEASGEGDRLLAVMSNGAAGRAAAEAAAALAAQGPEHRDAIMRMLMDDPDAEARAGAARGLGRLRDRAALPALLEALDDPDPEVRVRAATAIGKIVIVRFPYDARSPRPQRLRQIESIRRTLASAGVLGAARALPVAREP